MRPNDMPRPFAPDHSEPDVDLAARCRLWDSQWVNIVNHAECYRDIKKDDAVAMAVRLTEEAIAKNIREGKLPPIRGVIA